MARASSASVAAFNILLLATAAAAEPILIRTGGVGFDTGDPPRLSLSGESFSLVSLFPSIASPFACVPGGCSLGMPVSLTTVFGAPSAGLSLGAGFAVVRENSYE